MTWDSVRREIGDQSKAKGTAQHDLVRRNKIAEVERVSGVPLIIYVADFTDVGRAGQNGPGIQIDTDDKTGFLQALSDIASGPLDVLLHSPGGSPTATESIVNLLRSRFSPIRFIVPHTAKSAATMLALSGDEILLGEAAELGPIDPQMQFVTEQRPITVPARAAIDQFERAAVDIGQDSSRMRVWLPILRQYGPAFLQECQNAIELSEELVSSWLCSYMFAKDEDGKEKGKRVARWLADHNNFKSHSRAVWLEQMVEVEPSLNIRRLREIGSEFEAAVMALYWAIDVTFSGTDAIKMIEHQAGSAYIRLMRTAIVGPAAPAPNQPVPNPNRAERRGRLNRRGERPSRLATRRAVAHARTCQRDRDPAADAAASAGHEGHPTVQLPHHAPPRSRGPQRHYTGRRGRGRGGRQRRGERQSSGSRPDRSKAPSSSCACSAICSRRSVWVIT